MNKLKKALKSKTVWTIVVLFLVGGIENIAMYIPDTIETPLLGFLGFLAIHFKLNPSQNYDA